MSDVFSKMRLFSELNFSWAPTLLQLLQGTIYILHVTLFNQLNFLKRNQIL